jgi:hypothetical protein
MLEDWRQGTEGQPDACFGSIDNPLRHMHAEHECVGALLKELRRGQRHGRFDARDGLALSPLQAQSTKL